MVTNGHQSPAAEGFPSVGRQARRWAAPPVERAGMGGR